MMDLPESIIFDIHQMNSATVQMTADGVRPSGEGHRMRVRTGQAAA
jgi:hypothetical protein